MSEEPAEDTPSRVDVSPDQLGSGTVTYVLGRLRHPEFPDFTVTVDQCSFVLERGSGGKENGEEDDEIVRLIVTFPNPRAALYPGQPPMGHLSFDVRSIPGGTRLEGMV